MKTSHLFLVILWAIISCDKQTQPNPELNSPVNVEAASPELTKAVSLARSGSDEAIIEIVKMLQDDDRRVRNSVLNAIPQQEAYQLLIVRAEEGSPEAQLLLFLLSSQGRLDFDGDKAGLLADSFRGGNLNAGFLFLVLSKKQGASTFTDQDLNSAHELVSKDQIDTIGNPLAANFSKSDFNVAFNSKDFSAILDSRDQLSDRANSLLDLCRSINLK